jgi:DNA repair protein RecN (Recombination protein N)
MLVELVIENYAVIERLRVRFHRGLNLLTGETGSGKSIVVDALGLLLGGRASPDMIRTGAVRTRVSGIFTAPSDSGFQSLLDGAAIEFEDGELLVEREIQAGGKSRAFVGSRPVTLAFLKDLATGLGEIHGQHDQQRLFSPSAQIEMLDAFAGSHDSLEEVAGLYRDWRAHEREIQELDRTEQEKLRLADLWSFQRNEIERAAPRSGEDASLEAELRVLKNVARLQEHAQAAFVALYDAPESASTQIKLARRRLEELARIDPTLDPLLETLAPAAIWVAEVSRELRDYAARLEADPQRLEAVEARLAALGKLKLKYGATLDDVLVFLGNVRAQLDGLETAGERRAALIAERGRLESAYRDAAAHLSRIRHDAARKLEKRVQAELKHLAMERTVFQTRLLPAEWSEHGVDDLVFLVSPNAGEEPRPLDKIASGGEISRIALAIKTCIAASARNHPDRTPRTLVFDEVDAGVGGAAAEMVGRRLKQLAEGHQVLCVTHLPQIAGFADHHYAVDKRESKGRTLATIEELIGEARTREIGRMLSGQRLTPEALKHAEQLIRMSTD